MAKLDRLEDLPYNENIVYKNQRKLSLREACELLGLKPGTIYVYKHRRFGKEKIPVGKVIQCYFNDYYENHYPGLKATCEKKGWELSKLSAYKSKYLDVDTPNREVIYLYEQYLKTKEIVVFGKKYYSLLSACNDLNVSYGCFSNWVKKHKTAERQSMDKGQLLEQYIKEKSMSKIHPRTPNGIKIEKSVPETV